MSTEHHLTRSEDETLALGRSLAGRLGESAVVWLRGPLGSGKTVLAKGLFSARGIAPERVTSPTFMLIHRYREAPPLNHVDLYRLEHPEAILDLGLEELLEEPGLTVVEWAERLAPWFPQPDLDVNVEPRDDTTRSIVLTWNSEPTPER